MNAANCVSHSPETANILFDQTPYHRSWSTRYSYSEALYSYSCLDHEYSYSWSKHEYEYQTGTLTMNTRIHGKSTSLDPWVFIFEFSLIFQTTTALFEPKQLDSSLYCSVICLCEMCNRWTLPTSSSLFVLNYWPSISINHLRFNCIFEWNILAYPHSHAFSH